MTFVDDRDDADAKPIDLGRPPPDEPPPSDGDGDKQQEPPNAQYPAFLGHRWMTA
ncbi:hypothetical protein [Hartmannibacter diazotrophicus]|uniref:hypothetical protein n=1 Tax=Hartmannibacter diazotrophicus TaxID=1482074 RepID=UPI0012FDA73C|nr:hypothetical protein [Hartmannibacter diazotrophicus]